MGYAVDRHRLWFWLWGLAYRWIGLAAQWKQRLWATLAHRQQRECCNGYPTNTDAYTYTYSYSNTNAQPNCHADVQSHAGSDSQRHQQPTSGAG